MSSQLRRFLIAGLLLIISPVLLVSGYSILSESITFYTSSSYDSPLLRGVFITAVLVFTFIFVAGALFSFLHALSYYRQQLPHWITKTPRRVKVVFTISLSVVYALYHSVFTLMTAEDLVLRNQYVQFSLTDYQIAFLTRAMTMTFYFFVIAVVGGTLLKRFLVALNRIFPGFIHAYATLGIIALMFGAQLVDANVLSNSLYTLYVPTVPQNISEEPTTLGATTDGEKITIEKLAELPKKKQSEIPINTEPTPTPTNTPIPTPTPYPTMTPYPTPIPPTPTPTPTPLNKVSVPKNVNTKGWKQITTVPHHSYKYSYPDRLKHYTNFEEYLEKSVSALGINPNIGEETRYVLYEMSQSTQPLIGEKEVLLVWESYGYYSGWTFSQNFSNTINCKTNGSLTTTQYVRAQTIHSYGIFKANKLLGGVCRFSNNYFSFPIHQLYLPPSYISYFYLYDQVNDKRISIFHITRDPQIFASNEAELFTIIKSI